MKNRSIFLLLAITLSLIPITVFADEIRVTVDGEAVIFPGGQGAVIVDGRTLVPVRGVFETLGFDVDWDGDTRTAILTNAQHIVRITIDSDIFTTNDTSHALDVPAQLIEDRTMVPIRLPLESVGHYLDWDEATRTVIIRSLTATPPLAPPVFEMPLTFRPAPEPTPPTRWGEPEIFTSQALSGMMASAPHYTATRLTHPDRAMTESERDAWISDYFNRGGINAQELELYKIVNETRARYGLPPFYLCPQLSMASRLFSYLQVRYHTAGHDDRHYGSPRERIDFFGVHWQAWQENANAEVWLFRDDMHVGYDYLSPQEIVDIWMGSPEHRNHVLTTDTTHVGFGTDSGRERVVPTMKSVMPREVVDLRQFLTSSVILPNRRLTDNERRQWIDEYRATGGASHFERETIALINAIRAANGLNTFQTDENLMMAARFYAQTLTDQNLPPGFDEGPYGGIGETVTAFGGEWRTVNIFGGAQTPQLLTEGWMGSPGSEGNILMEGVTHIGIGSQAGGEYGTIHIMLVR
ncbi:MAG: stalk domain-containing protein [Defluviitaleaceae bacterium]|nr:stalk domain-containing protein [Defluviitaleaceae bacterium]